MSEYSHAIPIQHDLSPGPLWDFKHTLEELKALEKSDFYTYTAQYDQNPTKRGGKIFDTTTFQRYNYLPELEFKAIFGDTALKDGEKNDYTVFQCWGKAKGRIYLIDQYREKIKSTELERVFLDFWNKHKPIGNDPILLRAAYVEDKASGTQLIQKIQKNGNIPIIPIPRHKSKVERAIDLVSWINTGLVYLPEGVEWIIDYLLEFQKFSPLMNHKHDDQIDPTLDAIEQLLIRTSNYKPRKDDSSRKKTTIAPTKGSRKNW